jgi:NADH-quinone oxidoreductase subunit I
VQRREVAYGGFLKQILLVDLFRGLWVTFRNQNPKYIYTEQYPTEKDLTTFTYDLSRCMFCGLCEDACPVDALELAQDFELANYTREGGIWDRQMLEEGPRPTPYG